MDGPRITIIGGGSMQWAPNLIVDVLMEQQLRGATVTLHDIDPDAARLVGAYGEAVAHALSVEATVRVEDELSRALDGAQYVIIVISTGGLSAMAQDLSIPETFGVFHTVGDSAGPGGWSRFIRNFPVFQGLGRAIRRYAPTAVVLNYTNPMTTLTAVLDRELDAPVIGLCHGVFENYSFLAGQYGVTPAEVSASYAGINHFFWMDEISIAGKDVLAELSRSVAAGTSLTELEEARTGEVVHAGAFRSAHELATELFQLTGVLPFLEDRHTSEYVSWAITDTDRMASQRIVRTTIDERMRNQSQWSTGIRERLERGVEASELTGSGEGAVEVIRAHYTGTAHIDVGNVVNRGQIDNLPRGLVVETAVRTDANGFTPLSFGELPPVVVGLIEPHAHVFQMTIEACYVGDARAAKRALRLDPSLSHLSSEQVDSLGDALIAANGGFPESTDS